MLGPPEEGRRSAKNTKDAFVGNDVLIAKTKADPGIGAPATTKPFDAIETLVPRLAYEVGLGPTVPSLHSAHPVVSLICQIK